MSKKKDRSQVLLSTSLSQLNVENGRYQELVVLRFTTCFYRCPSRVAVDLNQQSILELEPFCKPHFPRSYPCLSSVTGFFGVPAGNGYWGTSLHASSEVHGFFDGSVDIAAPMRACVLFVLLTPYACGFSSCNARLALNRVLLSYRPAPSHILHLFKVSRARL